MNRNYISYLNPFEENKNPDKMVPIIAKINNLQAWRDLKSIRRFGSEISIPDKNEWFVTGHATMKDLESIVQQPFVLELEAGQTIKRVKFL